MPSKNIFASSRFLEAINQRLNQVSPTSSTIDCPYSISPWHIRASTNPDPYEDPFQTHGAIPSTKQPFNCASLTFPQNRQLSMLRSPPAPEKDTQWTRSRPPSLPFFETIDTNHSLNRAFLAYLSALAAELFLSSSTVHPSIHLL